MKKNNVQIKVIILSIFILTIICLPFLYHEIVNRSLVTDALLETHDKVPSLYQLGTFTGNHNEHPINLSTQLTNDLKEINQIKPEGTKFDFFLSHPFDALNETFFLQVNFVSDTLWDEFNLNTNDNTFIYQNPNLVNHLAVFMPLMREIVNVSLGLSIEISYTIGQRLPLSFEYQPIFPINYIRIFFNIDKLSSKIIEDFSLDFSLSITINDEYFIRIDTLDEITDIVMQIHNQVMLKIREYILIYINKSPLIEEIQSNKVYIDEFLIGYLSPIFLVLQFLLFLFTKSALIKEEEYFLLLLMRGFSTRTLKINGILKFGIFPVICSTVILLPVMIYLSEDTFFRLLGLIITWLIFHLSSSMWLVVSMVDKVNSSVNKIPPKREKSKFTPKLYFIPVFSGIIIIITIISSFLNIPVFPLFVVDYVIPTILIVLSCVLVWQFQLFLIENKKTVRGVTLPVFFKLISKKIFSQHTVLIALLLSSMIFGYNMIDIQYLDQKDSKALPRADFQVRIINQVHNVLGSNLIQALNAEENVSALSIISMPLEVIDYYGFSRYFTFNIVNQSEYNQYIHSLGLANDKNYFSDYFWISDINLQKLSIIPDTSLNIMNGNYSRTLPISIFRPFDDQTGITSNNDYTIISSVSTWNSYLFNISKKYEVSYEYELNILVSCEETQAEIENIILNNSNLTVNDFSIRNLRHSDKNVELTSMMMTFANVITHISFLITVILLELILVFNTGLIKELSRVSARFGKIKENLIFVGIFLAYLNLGVIISTILGMMIYLIDKSRLLAVIYRGIQIIIRSSEATILKREIVAISIYQVMLFLILMKLVYRRTSSYEIDYA